MRIATSTIYEQQTNSIDNLNYQNADISNQLSTGIKLNAPSDDPTQIAQDLNVRSSIANQTTVGTNIQNATASLTTTDSALASLTSVLQSARSIAVQGASDTVSAQQRQVLANQVDQLLSQAVSIANTQYGSDYVFGGTASTKAPVAAKGSPTSGVAFSGNLETQGQIVVNGQATPLSTNLQQAFNYQAADGSSDVFTVLQKLRDTLANGAAVDESAQSINVNGSVVTTGAAGATTLAAAPLATQLTADNGVPPSYSISIDGSSAAGVRNNVVVTFNSTDTIDDGNPASATSVVGKINAQTAQTGVSASFDQKTQRLVLTGANGTFYVTDVPTPGTGATSSANFTKAFGLVQQADTTNELSRQIGDVDKTLDVALNARSVIGSRIQTLTTIGNQNSSAIVDNQKVQSGIEDVDVAKAVAQLSQTQTALQAAYSVTTRLESKKLLDYVQ